MHEVATSASYAFRQCVPLMLEGPSPQNQKEVIQEGRDTILRIMTPLKKAWPSEVGTEV